MRDNVYLTQLLDIIWDSYFGDVPRVNEVTIKFGKHSYRQLGAIKSKRGSNEYSSIVVTRFFMNPEVPEYVIRTTIAHELVHYSHGFNSPLPKLFSHPHQGGIVDKDLKKRGFGEELKLANIWLKENWAGIVRQRVTKRRQKPRRRFLIFPF